MPPTIWLDDVVEWILRVALYALAVIGAGFIVGRMF